MIAKGTTHNNGTKLAAYMTTGKPGERAELWQLRGFEATNITDAFRDVQIMSQATKAWQPLFHVQVRNREGETLTREQWEYAADRIERMLGLTGQPRAISFHTYDANGDEHMHVAWSRIDEDTLTAKPLPFFKDRLKKISRELELHLALEPVTNQREGPIKFAPTKAQDEQARRLGVDPHEIRNTIRECWDHADCGKSFQAALEHEGFILAQGDRRNFVVIDPAGGIHALSKRILDVTASKIRDRLSDVSREDLPSVDMARALLPERTGERTPPDAEKDKEEPVWDRDAADRKWQEAVIDAAIDKEKLEQNFAEPQEQKDEEKQRGAGAGSRKKEGREQEERTDEARRQARNEKHWPVQAPAHQAWPDFGKAAEATTTDERVENLKGTAAHIWAAWQQSDSARAFATALDDKGVMFARVTAEEAYRSEREAAFAKETGRWAQRFKEGEIVLITEARPEYRRDGDIIEPSRIQKIEPSLAMKFLKSLGRLDKLEGIDATIKASNERAGQRTSFWQAIREKNAGDIQNWSGTNATNTQDHGNGAFSNAILSGIAGSLDVVADAFESFLAPPMTPERQREAAISASHREAEADRSIDFSRFTGELAARHRHVETERELQRQEEERQRGGRDR